eukprot:5815768-Pleurochrysis_carterae.AAC.3
MHAPLKDENAGLKSRCEYPSSSHSKLALVANAAITPERRGTQSKMRTTCAPKTATRASCACRRRAPATSAPTRQRRRQRHRQLPVAAARACG